MSSQDSPRGLPGTNGTLTLPSSPSSKPPPSQSEKEGLLETAVLSVYDLPYSDPPTCITLTACGVTARSGPPVARHKDRNSFRFNSGKTTSVVNLVASLRELYKSTLTVTVDYDKQAQLQTEYDLAQLRVHESKWLILTLTTSDSSEALTSTEGTTEADSDDEAPPTIRLRLCLSGPYRPEIASVLGLCNAWFGLVDSTEANAREAWKRLPGIPASFNKFLIASAVPIVATLVVASPVLAAIVMVGLPFLLPLVLTLLSLAGGLVLTGGVIYSSTKHGRSHVGGTLAPIWDSFVHSHAGQTFIYDTGPRPTPVSVCKQILPQEMWAKLVVSLMIDFIGSSSYLLPVVGEGFDLAWAPIQTVLIMAMYDPVTPNLKYVSFAEEILPFTDIVPSATMGWAMEFAVPQLFGIEATAPPISSVNLAEIPAAL